MSPFWAAARFFGETFSMPKKTERKPARAMRATMAGVPDDDLRLIAEWLAVR